MDKPRKLKIVYFGTDLSLFILDYLSTLHDISSIYTIEGERSRRVIQFGRRQGAPVSIIRPDTVEANRLTLSADVFFCCAYPFKIPIPAELKYGFNIHFSLLPQMRGPRPIPWILLNHREVAGVTIHKLAQEYDTGDILLTERLQIAKDETYHSYTVKCCLLAGCMIQTLFSNLDEYWNKARQQNELEATWAGSPTREDRTIDTSYSVGEVAKRMDAFGPLGMYLRVDQSNYRVLSLSQCLNGEFLQLPNSETFIEYGPNFLAVQFADGYIIFNRFYLDNG